MGKYYDIDPENCSVEELESTIKHLEQVEEFYEGNQQATKRAINQIYGVFGAVNAYNLANTKIAESITLQGQDLIKFSVVQINDYFRNIWKGDKDAHAKTAEIMKRKYPDFDGEKFKQLAESTTLSFDTLQRYGDTDSAYVTLQPIIDSCNIPIEQQTDFCLAVYEAVLEDYLNERFEQYAKDFNCDKNLEKFELEKISRTIIMLAKKNYICDVAWIDAPAFFEPLQHVTYTGYDVVRGSVPEFCRNCMKDFAEFCLGKLNNGIMPSYEELMHKMKEYKMKFAMQPPEEISKASNLSDYEKFIVSDATYPPVYAKVTDPNDKRAGKDIVCPIHVRGSARYNYMLNTVGKKYKSKYSFIKRGDKVSFYYTDADNVFAYPVGNFPMEFAPKMDIDTQFEKLLLSPLNRIVVALGYSEVPPSLTYSVALW